MILRPLRHPPHAQHGMTVFELLVVVAILVAVATIGTMNLDGVIDDSKDQVARAEMQEIAKAIQQFRRDTGYYPKQGPFGLDMTPYDGGVEPNSLPSHVAAADREDWFYSPANFWQLYDCPDVTSTNAQSWLGCINGRQQSWDPARGRGWRGPYLKRAGEGYVNLADSLDVTGHGDPTLGTLLSAVPGVADPFEQRNYPGTLLDWRSKADAAPGDREYLDHIGGPYFAFDLMDTTSNPAISTTDPNFRLQPRIVSMGRDGLYGGRNMDGRATGTDDACIPNDEDDIVLCLE